MLPLVPPKLNPGHGHQNVAHPSRGGGGCTASPTSALMPRILTYFNYSSTVSPYIFIFTSPCFYHPSGNITYNISHNPHSVPILQIRPLVSRAQARLILRQSCLPHPGRTVRICQPIRGPGFPVPGESCR